MSTINNTRSAANEKKVWRPISAVPVSAPANSKNPDSIHFIAIEELQGAHIGDIWEEADGGISEETLEEYVDESNRTQIKRITRTIPRATRYVLKYFSPDGQARNALSSYNGTREYKN